MGTKPSRGTRNMGTLTLRPTAPRTPQERLAKYRALRSTLDRSSYGDPKSLKEESREITETLRSERELANSVLLKRK